MNRGTWLAIQLYSFLIFLYPASFREEFGAEMTAVFAQSINDAARRNRRSLLLFILRELRDYPFSLLRQQWRNFMFLEPNLMTTIEKPRWFFYLAWIIGTVLCVPLAVLLTLAILLLNLNIIGDYIYVDGVRHIAEDYLGRYIFIPTVLLLMGMVQYGLLRRYLPRMGWWVLVTLAGWFLGLLLIFYRSDFWSAESAPKVLAFTGLGLTIGISQWLLLRRRVPRAGWWIAATALGWGMVGLVMDDAVGQFGIVALVLVPACVTAVALALLMNQKGSILWG